MIYTKPNSYHTGNNYDIILFIWTSFLNPLQRSWTVSDRSKSNLSTVGRLELLHFLIKAIFVMCIYATLLPHVFQLNFNNCRNFKKFHWNFSILFTLLKQNSNSIQINSNKFFLFFAHCIALMLSERLAALFEALQIKRCARKLPIAGVNKISIYAKNV